jgi:hypothetical protein
MKMHRLVSVTLVALSAFVLSGCLRKEMTSTWYIESDLSVVWTVLERDVRSTEDAPDDRRRAEADFIAEARQHTHPVARGLRQLNPTSVRSTVLRDRPPFSVDTDAVFPSLRVLGERILGRLGLTGYSSVERKGEGYEWTWSIDPHTKIVEDSLDEDLTSVFATDGIQLALAQGVFLEGGGIKLSDDHRIATFPINDILESLEGRRGDEPTVFIVRWKDR